MKLKDMCLCVALICVVLFSSCTRVGKFILYNNSGSIVNVQLVVTTTRSDYGQQTETSRISATAKIANEQQMETYFAANKIFIVTETTSWTYCFTNCPLHEYRQTHREKDKFRFQLESTGEIYILLPTENYPLKDFTNQPPGFPLKPIQ